MKILMELPFSLMYTIEYATLVEQLTSEHTFHMSVPQGDTQIKTNFRLSPKYSSFSIMYMFTMAMHTPWFYV